MGCSMIYGSETNCIPPTCSPVWPQSSHKWSREMSIVALIDNRDVIERIPSHLCFREQGGWVDFRSDREKGSAGERVSDEWH